MAANHPANPQKSNAADEAPPFLRTWRRVYIAVLVYLAGLILGLLICTRVFSA